MPKTKDIEQLDPKEYIIIKGARVNNLKDVSVAIPRNKLTVITGVSGSGKSSLAFDTLFAEGQRMYVESLSSYARQFLGRMEKPEVDYIKGISPAIAIEQKVNTRNARSTIGTTTEIYDYLKLLFARVGKTYSPESGDIVKKDTVDDVVTYLLSLEDGTRYTVLAPLKVGKDRSLEKELEILLQKGYSRITLNGEVAFIEDAIETIKNTSKADINVVIDRASVAKEDESMQFRAGDSVQTAFFEGEGECIVDVAGGDTKHFSDRFELDGILFEEPTVNFFMFNNPYGACKRCEGFGHVLGIDHDLVFPDKTMSIYEGAIAPWNSEKMKKWLDPLIKNGIRFDFPIHRPYSDLTESEKELLWTGNEHFSGLDEFFEFLAGQAHKIQYRVMLSRYRGRTVCPDCKGTRLRKDAGYVKIAGKSIQDLVLMPVEELLVFFDTLELDAHDLKIAERLTKEIKSRLFYLNEVGLGYLTLNRLTSTLSGGEFQRIKLSTSLGSALVGSMYILDEPSIGLHPRDTQRLIQVLEKLRNIGNTVVVVEHEEEVMMSADEIIDIGPDAGSYGGKLIYQGSLKDMTSDDPSHTAQYLKGKASIPVPEKRRPFHRYIEIKGARENNLQNLDVKIPLNTITCITGVSGSGKSTLVKKILYPAIKKLHQGYGEFTGAFDTIEGDVNDVKQVEFVDQNPIGKSSRSNPVTYVKAYDAIRSLYADLPLAKQRGYKPAFFSFNVDGGRCEECQGEGQVKIEMQFMADIYLTCDSCKGRRFKQEVLEVKYKDKDISDVLELTIDDAIEFFQDEPKIVDKLKPLQRVGLGYIGLGQSSNTLSGGEAQRVKLAYFLSKGNNPEPTLFIFDEPTTGLHFHDINKLMSSINALVDKGNSVVIIEHNTDVIKCADWIIDLGPEGGDKGGTLVFEGTPEAMIEQKEGYTGKFLQSKLEKTE